MMLPLFQFTVNGQAGQSGPVALWWQALGSNPGQEWPLSHSMVA